MIRLILIIYEIKTDHQVEGYWIWTIVYLLRESRLIEIENLQGKSRRERDDLMRIWQ